jgi:hypothetical protein
MRERELPLRLNLRLRPCAKDTRPYELPRRLMIEKNRVRKGRAGRSWDARTSSPGGVNQPRLKRAAEEGNLGLIFVDRRGPSEDILSRLAWRSENFEFIKRLDQGY